MLFCSPRIIEGRSEQTPTGNNGPKVKNEKQNKLRIRKRSIIQNEPLTSSPGQLVIGQFVVGRFNKPITFKVVV